CSSLLLLLLLLPHTLFVFKLLSGFHLQRIRAVQPKTPIGKPIRRNQFSPNMAKCFSYTATQDSCYRYSFARAGLKSSTTDLGDGGTIMHCWSPKSPSKSKPNLVLIHGFGANAMWQFNDFISPLKSKFNLYIPDLLFFGDSHTTRTDRSESFQARCVVSLMAAHGVLRMDLMGLSYGGFVAYRIAAEYPERVGRVVLGCAGVCLEEKDMVDGMFHVKSVDEAVGILLPQTPEKCRQLLRLSFYKPPPVAPSCFLSDFIEVMCTEYLQERRELIETLHRDRKLSSLPRITQPYWGECRAGDTEECRACTECREA
ncbi:Uncharacterized protein Mb2734, partial [Linum grandiflorum]